MPDERYVEEFAEDDDDDEAHLEEEDDDEGTLAELSRRERLVLRRARAEARAAYQEGVGTRRRRMRKLRRRLGRIRKTRGHTVRLRPAKGAGALRVVGRRGRAVRLPLKSRVVTLKQFDALRRVVNRNAAISAKVDRTQTASLRRAVKLLGDQIGKGDRRIAKGIVALERGLATSRLRLAPRWDRVLREQRIRQLTDAMVIASAVPLFKAYGDIDNLLGSNNISLAVILGTMLFGDELLKLLDSSSTAPISRIWQYAAPLVVVGTGILMLKGSSTQFKSGFAETNDRGVAQVTLLGDDDVGDRDLSRQPVLARVVDDPGNISPVRTSITGGTLTMTISGIGNPVLRQKLVYFVDLRAVSGP